MALKLLGVAGTLASPVRLDSEGVPGVIGALTGEFDRRLNATAEQRLRRFRTHNYSQWRQKHMRLSWIAGMYSLLAPLQAHAVDRVIRGDGDDSRVCSEAFPCRTIATALRLASPGDRIVMGPGVYSERVSLRRNVEIIGAGASNTIIDGGGAGRAMEVLDRASVAIRDVTIRNGRLGGTTSFSGAGLYVSPGSLLALNFCVVTSNSIDARNLNAPVFAHGAGIANDFGDLRIEDSEIRGNRAYGSSGASGGGIYSTGKLTMRRSSVTENEVAATTNSSVGGGIYNLGIGQVENSTISTNRALQPTGGAAGNAGGLANSGSLTLTHVTITMNFAAGGNGGGLLASARLTIANSIVAGNLARDPTDPQDCSGTNIISRGGNLIGKREGCNFAAHASDRLGTNMFPRDAELNPLTAIRGRLVRHHELKTTSAAIDMAETTVCTAQDATGLKRPQGPNCDSGAIESTHQLPVIAPIEVDISRVTQGLDYDLLTGTWVQRIANRRTLVRTQIASPRRERLVIASSCEVRQLTSIIYIPSNGGWKRVPVNQGARTLPANVSPAGHPVDARPSGAWLDSPVIECWIERDLVRSPGDYQVNLWVQLAGDVVPSLVNLGSHTFYPATGITMLVLPFETPPSHPEHAPWGAHMLAAIVKGIEDAAKRLPFPGEARHVQTYDLQPEYPSGIQYYILSSLTCPDPSGPAASDPDEQARRVTEALHKCTTENDVRVKEQLANINRINAEREQRDGRPRIRFDLPYVVMLSKSAGGGQARGAVGNCVSTSAIDATATDGRGGTIIGHELAHCLGLIDPVSRHHDGSTEPPGGPLKSPAHSPTWTIPVARNGQVVDLSSGSDMTGAISIMHPTPAGDAKSFLEIWDWNWLREQRLRGSSIVTRLATVSPRRKTPLFSSICDLFRRRTAFELSGVISDTGQFNWLYSQRRRIAKSEVLSPQASASRYRLVFIGRRGDELSSHSFEPGFTISDAPLGTPKAAPIAILTSAPRGAVGWQIQRDGFVSFSQDVSAKKPAIRNSAAAATTDTLAIKWRASDADSPALRARLFHKAKGSERMIATGIADMVWRADASFFPWSAGDSFRVEVSDGYHTRSRKVKAREYSAPSRAAVSITMSHEAPIVEGQPLKVAAGVHDGVGAVVTPDWVSWRSDRDGDLGVGQSIKTMLTAGKHSLQATAMIGGSEYRTTIPISVVGDGDRDGLPDSFERAHPCLSSGMADGDLDADGDGLRNTFEFRLRTNPCAVDTDGDGSDDYAEVLAGSSAVDAASRPLPDGPRPADPRVVMPTCQASSTVRVPLGRGQSSAPVRTVPNTDWMSASVVTGAPSVLEIRADCSSLPEGDYSAEVSIKADDSRPHFVRVLVKVDRP